MNFLKASHIHFTGIKGVGMTALSLCAQDLRIKVSGSDLDEPFVTDEILKKRRIRWQPGFSTRHVPVYPERSRRANSLLVYTAAHQGSHNPQVLFAQRQGIPTLSHAQALAQAMSGKIGLAVCGVGGKTTTSAMLATILDQAQLHPSFAIGVGNIPSLHTPGRYDRQGKHFVVEADEYATDPPHDLTPRFLYLHPHLIIATNIEFDHPDIYADLDQTKAAFLNFFNRLPPDGLLLINLDSPINRSLISRLTIPYQTYGTHPQADWRLENSTVTHQGVSQTLNLKVPGNINALNATAALAAAVFLGVDGRTAATALSRFTGTQRRFEAIAKINQVYLYDDYAHHPRQLKATLQAAKSYFPGHQLIAIFQPHTYSRTRALVNEFAKSFEFADQVIFLPIYASARETPDPTISSQILAHTTAQFHPRSYFLTPQDLGDFLLHHLNPPTVIFTLGAGDIYLLHRELISVLKTFTPK